MLTCKYKNLNHTQNRLSLPYTLGTHTHHKADKANEQRSTDTILKLQHNTCLCSYYTTP